MSESKYAKAATITSPLTEGLFVGYRYFDSHEVEPAFAFGHGFSCATFEYSDLAVAKGHQGVEVNLRVSKTGPVQGAEVVQIYVSDDESTHLTLTLGDEAISFYHPDKSGWFLEPGTFTIQVGGSSRDIRLQVQVGL